MNPMRKETEKKKVCSNSSTPRWQTGQSLPFFMYFRYLLKALSPDRVAKKKKLGLCRHWGCSRPARPGRSDCEVCKSRKYRISHPARYAWHSLKVSAYKRKIPFRLSFEDFVSFCRETGYLDKKGKRPASMTVDRIDPLGAYEPGNIRALPHAENSALGFYGQPTPFNSDENPF